MKNIWCLIIAVLSLCSCVGNRARQDALGPIAQDIWPNVQVDFERGLADGLADGDLNEQGAAVLNNFAQALGASLQAGDRIALGGVPWATEMAPWAVRGIDTALAAGELGPNGANILRQRLSNFTEVILTLQGKLVGWTRGTGARERPNANPYIRERRFQEVCR